MITTFFFFSLENEVAKKFNYTLADTSKPTVVVDPVTNQEVLQGKLRGCKQGPF